MSSAPKVSLAISVYKVEPFIERCVRSLFEQTFEDIEFLFIDDCTPDRSMEIMWQVLEDYPNRKSQVHVVSHEKNMGTAITKRECYQRANGEYVLVIDSDDYLELDAVETMYNKTQEDDADIVLCNIKRHYPKAEWVIQLAPNGVQGNGENVRDDIINRYVTPSLCCKMIKRAVLNENRILWPTGDYAEDYVISVQAAYYARRISLVDRPLYHYCFVQDSFCNDSSEDNVMKKYNEFIDNFNIVCHFLNKEGVEEKYETGIFLNKIRAKAHLQSLIGQWKYRKLWIKTYPEVNRTFLFGDRYRKPSYRERFWILAMSLGLYPKYKRLIYSKRLRPRPGWYPV